jgi:hypothetical protein
MKNMKITKKKRNQDVQLRFGCLAAGLLHVLHALHGEKWRLEPSRCRLIWAIKKCV